MFGFIGRVLTKAAPSKDAKSATAKSVTKAAKKTPPSWAEQQSAARTSAIAETKARSDKLITPERAALISNAMAVRRAKQVILADLSDESRAKLVVMAMKALANEGRD